MLVNRIPSSPQSPEIERVGGPARVRSLHMFLFNARRGVVITNQVFPTYQVPESVLFVLSLWIDERKLFPGDYV